MTIQIIETRPKNSEAMRLKGGLYTLTTILILNDALDEFDNQLTEKTSQAPKFFENTPVVLDVHLIYHTAFNLKGYLDCLKKHHLIPIGIKGGDAVFNRRARALGLAILRDDSKEQRKSPIEQKSPSIPSEKKEAPSNGIENLIVTTPIRSGQQVFASGDLIVRAPVSPGAELIAAGNIHIYGCLRGRALAGVNGDKEARIFCLSLEAELVSIAGEYLVSEDIPPNHWKQATSLYLKNDKICLESLSI